MGNRTSKSSLRNAFVYLNISARTIAADDHKFWNQIWDEDQNSAAEIIKAIRVEEIRMLRDGSPANFATLTYKMVEKLYLITGTLCNTYSQQDAALNSVGILTRLIPCIYEDKSWSTFLINNHMDTSTAWPALDGALKYPLKNSDERNYSNYLPQCAKSPLELDKSNDNDKSRLIKKIITPDLISMTEMSNYAERLHKEVRIIGDQSVTTKSSINKSISLLDILINSICDLLFCPEFTVPSKTGGFLASRVDTPPDDIRSVTSIDFVWEAGVGFESSANSTTVFDKSRNELLRLLLVLASPVLYYSIESSLSFRNLPIELMISSKNRHSLPLFTSLLNTSLAFDPTRLSLTSLLFDDDREELVGTSIQLLNCILEYSISHDDNANISKLEGKNLFIDYVSRLHREEDMIFIIKGLTRLFNSGLGPGNLLTTARRFKYDFELMLLLRFLRSYNEKFLHMLSKFEDDLRILVALLYHVNENFQDTSNSAKTFIAVNEILALSKERNVSVRLHKPYLANVMSNIPTFTGSHADLLIVVFHKIILYGEDTYHLFHYLMIILANVSPYLRDLSILASKCLIQLFEIFTSPYVILTEARYHSLVRPLLDIFNNVIQYDFCRNANLICVIMSKKSIFKELDNLTTTQKGINKVFRKLQEKLDAQGESTQPKAKPTDEVASIILGSTRTSALNSQPSKLNVPSHESSIITLSINEPNSQAVRIIDKSLDKATFGGDSNWMLSDAGWKVSPDWLREWKKELPLETTKRMIEVLEPEFEKLGFSDMSQPAQLERMVKFISNGTLVGLLPVDRPAKVGRYTVKFESVAWLRACTWGITYARSGLWSGTSAQLIKPI